jgi:predicted NAD-dependent protein-ADP-ribosyltransferase YbiA (DUF1768 family)
MAELVREGRADSNLPTHMSHRSIVFKRPGEEPYGVFSNFCAGFPISVAGSTFDSSEHFFQAMKFTPANSGRERTADGLPFGSFTFSKEMETPGTRVFLSGTVAACRTPADARAMGSTDIELEGGDYSGGSDDNGGGSRVATLRADWDHVREDVMRSALKLKFSQHASLRKLLLETDNATIVERSERDLFWAQSADGRGENKLGMLLMKTREELRGAAPPAEDSATGSSAASSARAPQGQDFDYFVVLDFEATCDDRQGFTPVEVIELPSVLVDARTMEVVDTIQLYVKPQVHAELTPFCSKLTGITQGDVDTGAGPFPVALGDYISWLTRHKLASRDSEHLSWCFVTCGDWDLRTMLPGQVSLCDATAQELVGSVPEFGR